MFTGDIIVCAENLNELTIKLQKLIRDYRKVAGYMVNIQKSIAFCVPAMSEWNLK